MKPCTRKKIGLTLIALGIISFIIILFTGWGMIEVPSEDFRDVVINFSVQNNFSSYNLVNDDLVCHVPQCIVREGN